MSLVLRKFPPIPYTSFMSAIWHRLLFFISSRFRHDYQTCSFLTRLS
jgi:hypothetical protein